MSEVYKIKIEKHFEDLLEFFKTRAESTANSFLNEDYYLKTGNTKKDIDFSVFIYQTYEQLCFFPSEEIIQKFKHYGVPKPILKWLIPMDSILSEIECIEQNRGQIFLKNLALLNIYLHLTIKIRAEIMGWSSRQKWFKEDPDFEKIYKNFFRRCRQS